MPTTPARSALAGERLDRFFFVRLRVACMTQTTTGLRIGSGAALLQQAKQVLYERRSLP